MSFVSSKDNILCRLINVELYEIFAIINRAIKGLHCIIYRPTIGCLLLVFYRKTNVIQRCPTCAYFIQNEHFEMHIFKRNDFYFHFCRCLLFRGPSNWLEINIGLGTGLSPKKRQMCAWHNIRLTAHARVPFLRLFGCSLKSLSRLTTNRPPKLLALFAGSPSVSGFPTQRTNNLESVPRDNTDH